MATTWSVTAPVAAKVVCDSGTGAAPTAATEGCPLYFADAGRSIRGLGLMIEADASQTLSGAGSLLAYVYNDVAAAWARCPDLDVTISPSVAGVRRQAFSGFPVYAGRVGSRIAWIPSGVTVYVNGDL